LIRVLGAVVMSVGIVACAGSGSVTTGSRRPAVRRNGVSTSTSTATSTTTVAPTTTTAPAPQFASAVAPITGTVASRVSGSSWRAGCPVPLTSLRYLTLSYWGFDGAPHTGELIVNADAVEAVTGAFTRLFAAHFPIRRMQLVDDFGADDFRSIEADNTSAFNCRERSTGGGVWSQHAFGRAIDVNPIENPYVDGGTTSHPASRSYLDRTDVRPGMATTAGELVASFAAVGWGWGGRWSSPVDLQHFSATGR
jgi:hypothetical protein